MKGKREVSNLVYNINVLAFKSLFLLLRRQESSQSELANPLSYNSTVSSKFCINVQILGDMGKTFFQDWKICKGFLFQLSNE